jgi:signal transduction histidine kinase
MEIIVSEVNRLEKLVAEVLAYTRIATPEYEATDINLLIRNVTTTMQEIIAGNSIRLVLSLDSTLQPAKVDQFQIRQALMNLIDNALDAMPLGGVLTISTSREHGFLEIGITDTGTGIARENWDKLFVPFFTTKPSGTGLGLAVVAQIIENHHGSLRFESEADKGSSFLIRLALEPRCSLVEPNPLLAVNNPIGVSQ